MRRIERRTWAALPALLAAIILLAGCEPGDVNMVACVFGDRIACDALLNPPPPPPPPVAGAPAAPTGLTFAITEAGVVLDWDDNNESDLDRYNVWRGTFDHRGAVRYEGIHSSTDSRFTDTFTHEQGTTYFYAVTALDVQQNEGARSNVVSLFWCVPANACDEAAGPPAAPTGLVAVAQDAAGLSLEWNDNAEPDLDAYFLYRATAPGAYGSALFYTGPHESGAKVSAEVYDLVPFTTYHFVVTAVDSDGDGLESARSSELTVRYCPSSLRDCPQPPGAATGLRLVSRSAAGISIAWDVTPGANVTGYVVSRLFLPKVLGTTTGPAFVDHEPDDTFPNDYVVAAIDADGRRGPTSNALTVDWCGPANPTCATAPAAPTGLTATPEPFQISLDWADNTETDLAGYRAYWAEQQAGPWTTVHSGLLTVSQRTVFDLPITRPFFFRVTAVDTAGRESPPSAVVSATACGQTCTGASSPGSLRRRPAALASGPKAFPFSLAVSGQLGPGGTTRRDGDRVLGSGFRYTGTFALDRAQKGLDPELRQLAAAGLGGTWSARFDWSITPGATATKSGIALATFADPALGKACLRLDEVSTVKKRGTTRRIVTSGVFTFLGGSAEAATLLGGATYDVESHLDGSLLYTGQGRPATGGAPLPAECTVLAAS